jgi:hypothetical protein
LKTKLTQRRKGAKTQSSEKQTDIQPSMRVLLTFVVLVAVSGCSNNHTSLPAPASDPELKHLVGQTVELRGQFSLRGKVAPYVQVSGEPVYLMPHGSFSWGSDYERMEGKIVSVSGVLHFQHFEHGKVDDSVAQPHDYFYFDAETAKVRLE